MFVTKRQPTLINITTNNNTNTNTATHHGQKIWGTWGGGAKQTNKKQNTDKITRTQHYQLTHIRQTSQTTKPHKQEDRTNTTATNTKAKTKHSTIRTDTEPNKPKTHNIQKAARTNKPTTKANQHKQQYTQHVCKKDNQH